MAKIICVGAQFVDTHCHNAGGRDKVYHYAVPGDETIEPQIGDLIISSSQTIEADETRPSEDSFLLSDVRFARIVSLHLDIHEKTTRSYLVLVKKPLIVERRRQQTTVIAALKKKAEAMKRLKAMLEEQSMMEVYRKLAETNQEARELLAVIEN